MEKQAEVKAVYADNGYGRDVYMTVMKQDSETLWCVEGRWFPGWERDQSAKFHKVPRHKARIADR